MPSGYLTRTADAPPAALGGTVSRVTSSREMPPAAALPLVVPCPVHSRHAVAAIRVGQPLAALARVGLVLRRVVLARASVAWPGRTRRPPRAGRWRDPGSIARSCRRHAPAGSGRARRPRPSCWRPSRTSKRARHPASAGPASDVKGEVERCSSVTPLASQAHAVNLRVRAGPRCRRAPSIAGGGVRWRRRTRPTDPSPPGRYSRPSNSSTTMTTTINPSAPLGP